jgi:hypothetical protein
MTTKRSVRWWLSAVAACGLFGCSQNKTGLHVPDAGAGGQTKADAAAGGAGGGMGGAAGNTGRGGSGGGSGGAAAGGTTGRGGAGGGALVDAPVSGGAGGNLTADAAAGSDGSAGGATGTGGTNGGTGGTTRTGGTGGGSTCPMVPPCNWCGGTNIYDSNGCVIGWRCANGANPCTTLACDDASNPCEAGYTCGSDRLCWPVGTGGAGGGGGATGRGGTGGSTTTCPPIASCNWCGGAAVNDSAGCIVGWRCANGADPCTTQPCTSTSGCATGYECGTDQLCWPVGTGGAGGRGGAGGSGGMGGTGGMTGTGQVGVRCLNALCNTGQVCCVSESSSTPTLTCTSQAECADFAVTCDGPEDCGGAGHHCCLPSGAIMQTTCTTGNCLAGLAMCHNGADCAAGETCCSAITFGYSHGYCQTGACPR